MDIQEKTIATLNKSSAAAAKLEMRLRFQGNNKEADSVAEKRKEILRLTEDLIAKAMGEWVENSEEILADINEANKEVGKEIRAISKKVKVAEKVIKATKSLDKVIKKATELLV